MRSIQRAIRHFAELSATNVSVSIAFFFIIWNFNWPRIFFHHFVSTWAVKKMKSSDPDARRIIRTCGYRRSQKDCYSVDNDHHVETVCQCFGDGCNSAANLSIFSFISTLTLVSGFYISIWICLFLSVNTYSQIYFLPFFYVIFIC